MTGTSFTDLSSIRIAMAALTVNAELWVSGRRHRSFHLSTLGGRTRPSTAAPDPRPANPACWHFADIAVRFAPIAVIPEGQTMFCTYDVSVTTSSGPVDQFAPLTSSVFDRIQICQGFKRYFIGRLR
jgi:hypothetical protein